MGVMRDISSMVKTYSSLVTFAVIAVADYIWEDKYFTCPCVDTGLKVAYSLAFVLSPAIFLLLADSNWRVLSMSCKNCCCENFCRKRSGFTRPCILAGAWIFYSVMDPRFSECIMSERFRRDTQKNCTAEDQAQGELKSAFAITILCVSIIVLFYIMVDNCCCKGTCRNCCKDCCTCCKQVNVGILTSRNELTGQTLIVLEEEDLLEDDLVKQLDDTDFKVLESKLTRGQMMIIKKIREEMNLSTTQDPTAPSATGPSGAAPPGANSPDALSVTAPSFAAAPPAASDPGARISHENQSISIKINEYQTQLQGVAQSKEESDYSAGYDDDAFKKTFRQPKRMFKKVKQEDEIPLQAGPPAPSYNTVGSSRV